jgi:hypothetical protein
LTGLKPERNTGHHVVDGFEAARVIELERGAQRVADDECSQAANDSVANIHTSGAGRHGLLPQVRNLLTSEGLTVNWILGAHEA